MNTPMMYCLNNCCFICNSSAFVSSRIRVGVDIFKDETPLKSGKILKDVLSAIIGRPVVQDGSQSDVLCNKCQKIIVEYDCLMNRCKKIQDDLLNNFKKTLTKLKVNYDTYNLDVPNLMLKAENGKEPYLPLTGWKEATVSEESSEASNSFSGVGEAIVPFQGIKEANSSGQGIREANSSTQGNGETRIIIQGSKAASSVEGKKEPTFDGKRIVLSASKLQPLPPNFVLKSGSFPVVPIRSNFPVVPKLQAITTQNSNVVVTSSPTKPFQSKMTVDQKMITTKIGELKKDMFKNQTQKSIPVVKISCSTESNQLNTARTELASLLKFGSPPTLKTESVYTLNVTSMPKDFLTTAMLGEQNNVKKELTLSDGEAADDNPMEIDEECSLAVLTQNKYTHARDTAQILEKLNEQMDASDKDSYMRLVPAEDIMIIDNKSEGDSEGHTIVMAENGSFIRVVSGQKLMIGDKEISLVLPEDMDHLDTGDSQDSNDDSQIELQVSGDEETANAIIAAAQEQGGAFIKVESGEMYRVESVESKEHSEDDAEDDFQIERKENGKYRCRFCEKHLDSEMVFEGGAAAMMEHLKQAHDARTYICTVCGKFIRRKSDYVKHLSEHADSDYTVCVDKSKLHECTLCHKKFSSRVLLAEHANTHAGARPHVCAVCHKSFASKYTYQSHAKTHTNRPRPYKCSQCDKSFFTQQNLSQHQKTHSGIKDFVCKICDKAFGTQHNLEVHGVVHSRKKPFECSTCGKAFARRAELRDHARIHTGERPFACEVCGARFTQRSNLYSHRRATHMDDKRYACQLCPKRFKRRRLLDYHVKASHTGERPLTCNICHATFVYPEHYKKHARIHSGEKPYTCEICGKSFNSRDNRNTHRFVHSDRKPYECLVCGAGYMRKQLLYQHMNTRGHMAESIVVNQPRLAESNVLKSPPSSTIVHLGGGTEVDDGSMEPTGTIFETAEEMTADTAEKMLGKTINISQHGEATLVTIHNIDGELKADDALLETVTVDQLEQAQVGSGVMRLVQVQLPGGDCGWVAVD